MTDVENKVVPVIYALMVQINAISAKAAIKSTCPQGLHEDTGLLIHGSHQILIIG